MMGYLLLQTWEGLRNSSTPGENFVQNRGLQPSDLSDTESRYSAVKMYLYPDDCGRCPLIFMKRSFPKAQSFENMFFLDRRKIG